MKKYLDENGLQRVKYNMEKIFDKKFPVNFYMYETTEEFNDDISSKQSGDIAIVQDEEFIQRQKADIFNSFYVANYLSLVPMYDEDKIYTYIDGMGVPRIEVTINVNDNTIDIFIKDKNEHIKYEESGFGYALTQGTAGNYNIGYFVHFLSSATESEDANINPNTSYEYDTYTLGYLFRARKDVVNIYTYNSLAEFQKWEKIAKEESLNTAITNLRNYIDNKLPFNIYKYNSENDFYMDTSEKQSGDIAVITYETKEDTDSSTFFNKFILLNNYSRFALGTPFETTETYYYQTSFGNKLLEITVSSTTISIEFTNISNEKEIIEYTWQANRSRYELTSGTVGLKELSENVMFLSEEYSPDSDSYIYYKYDDRLGIILAQPINSADFNIYSESNWVSFAKSSEVNKLRNEINNLKSATQDSGWIEATLLNGATTGLASKGAVRYRKIGKCVQIIGSVSNITAATTVMRLPEGFRPSARIDNITAMSGARFARVNYGTNGDVDVELISDNTWNEERWFSLDCMFFTD